MLTGLILSLVHVIYNTCTPTLGYVWKYYLDDRSIMVCQNYEANNHILAHEFSHRVRYNRMTPKGKEIYSWIRNKYPYPSEYAKTSMIESFAEDWRMILQGNKQRNNPKVSFVRKIMKSLFPNK